MFNTTGKIAIAQIAFFALALLPAQYVLLRHARRGILGWTFIVTFCIIRIVGAAIIINDESKNNPISEAGLIVSSVAIAPMIFAVGGIAHESFGSIEQYQTLIFGRAQDLMTHLITVGAIVLLVIGYLNFEGTDKTTHDMKIGLDLIRAGGIVLILVWAILVAIVLVSFMYRRALRAEKQLIIGVSVALVCLFIRILYTVLGAFINSTSWSVLSGGTLAEHVVLDVLPEFILVIALLSAGVLSRNIDRESEAAVRTKNNSNQDEEIPYVSQFQDGQRSGAIATK